MPKTNHPKTTEAAEDAEDVRYLRNLRKKPRRFRPLEDVVAEIEAGLRPPRIRRRREVYR